MSNVRRAVIFSSAEMIAYAKHIIGSRLGALGEVVDLRDFVESTFNLILSHGHACADSGVFYYESLSGQMPVWLSESKTPYDILTDYRLPADDAYDLCGEMYDYLSRQVHGFFGGLNQDLDYGFHTLPSGDIRMNEYDVVAKESDTTDEFLKSIEEGLDRGDWYPEKMRALVGRA